MDRMIKLIDLFPSSKEQETNMSVPLFHHILICEIVNPLYLLFFLGQFYLNGVFINQFMACKLINAIFKDLLLMYPLFGLLVFDFFIFLERDQSLWNFAQITNAFTNDV